MKEYCVYKHTSPSGKVYIGITSQKPKERWDNGRGYKNNIYFCNAIQKYGWDNMNHEVLFENLTQEEAEHKEAELIALYKSDKREFGYNIALGGRINSVSEETRRKLSESHKGYVPTEEQRRKIGEAHRGEKHWNYGNRMSDEMRRRISEKQKGNKPWCTGRNLTAEHRAKISKSHIGLKPSVETIAKWRTTNIERGAFKAVEQIEPNTNETIAIFVSISEASKQTGLDHRSIQKVCKGQRKTAGGFKWRYKNRTNAT